MNLKPFVINNFFSTEVFSSIKDFIGSRLDKNALGVELLEDNDVYFRQYAIDPPFLANIHKQLAPYVSELLNVPLKPTHTFLSLYQNNGTCPIHIDRSHCFVAVDYLVSQDDPEPWPMCVSDPMDNNRQTIESINFENRDEDYFDRVKKTENWTTFNLEPNDALFFTGTHSWHYRPKPLVGKSTIILWHFEEGKNGNH